ncbi:MAG: glucose-6-phosphate isomerase [Bacillota bacterium]
MADLLSIKLEHLFPGTGEMGLPARPEFAEMGSQFRDRFEEFRVSLDQERFPLTLPFTMTGEIPRIKSLAGYIRDRYNDVLLIGIGGSSLGARAIMQYLRGPYYNLNSRPRLFILDNIDPALAHKLEEVLDFRRTALIYISKSGSTAESAANFSYFYRKYRTAGGNPRDVVIICDRAENGINRIARDMGCRLLFTPRELGGRFSVLSCVGFLPAEIIGIDSEEMLEGAAAIRRRIRNEPPECSVLMGLGVGLFMLARQGRSIHVLFNYSSLLSDFGLWFMQLWGESLGKKVSLSREVVRAGTTPLNAIGATDQHSLLQLFKDGPQDKVYGFIRVAEPPRDLSIPGEFPQEDEYAYFEGHTMNQQLHIQQLATEFSLFQEGNPCYRITLRDYSPAALGALFYFYQALTVFSGALWAINPFDQPGVEEGKRITYSLMGRKSYAYQRLQYEAEVTAYDGSKTASWGLNPMMGAKIPWNRLRRF